MPILEVELVCQHESDQLSTLAQDLADALAPVLNSPAGRTWVKIYLLAAERYAENARPLAAEQLPVFIKILQREIAQGTALEAQVRALTEAAARVLQRPPECIHIEYLPPAIGRQAFGGHLVK